MVNAISHIPLPGPICPAGGSDAFVAGPENLLARHVIQSCLERVATEVSPLVFYGPSGSGKTHLACGLAAWWQRHLPSGRVRCLTGAEFAQTYGAAVADDRVPQWRWQIHHCELLVIDDLAPLSGKTGAQQELRQALDVLADRDALVIVTARSLPTHARGLLPSLRSRLSLGLAVPLALPSPGTRRLLVDQWAVSHGLALSERAAQSLADGLDVSVPALIAAVRELGQSVQDAGQAIDAGQARRFVTGRAAGATPSLRDIALLTAKYFGLQVADLKGPLRRRPLVAGRSLAMYLARQMTGNSLEQIGKYFGGRDHTTVLHGCRRTERLLRRDRAIRQAIGDLKRALVAR